MKKYIAIALLLIGLTSMENANLSENELAQVEQKLGPIIKYWRTEVLNLGGGVFCKKIPAYYEEESGNYNSPDPDWGGTKDFIVDPELDSVQHEAANSYFNELPYDTCQ